MAQMESLRGLCGASCVDIWIPQALYVLACRGCMLWQKGCVVWARAWICVFPLLGLGADVKGDGRCFFEVRPFMLCVSLFEVGLGYGTRAAMEYRHLCSPLHVRGTGPGELAAVHTAAQPGRQALRSDGVACVGFGLCKTYICYTTGSGRVWLDWALRAPSLSRFGIGF